MNLMLAIQSSVIVSAVVVFLLVVLLLVAVLLYAKKKLTPSGEVTIDINDGEKQLKVEPGQTLLTALGSNKIFLPSACGGGGTCAMCRCQVHDGAGTILPTETGYFTRKEQNADWRLACQVKVREDMKMEDRKSTRLNSSHVRISYAVFCLKKK